MKFLALLFITFLSSFALSQSVCNEWCMVKHLQSINAVSLDSVIKFGENKCDDCEVIVERIKSSLINEVSSNLDENDNKTCIVNFFNDNKLTDLFLKGITYEKLNMTQNKNSETWKTKSTEDALSVARVLCTKKKLTEEEFSQTALLLALSTLLKLHDYEDSEKNCVMKHLFEEKVIDLTQFDISADSTNSTECQVIRSEFESRIVLTLDAWTVKRIVSIYGFSSNSFQECYKENLANQKIFLKVAVFYLASNLELSDADQEKVQEDFSQMIVDFNKSYYNCIEKLLEY